jgi:glycosyltransferase involved in cell wall biosynthesis
MGREEKPRIALVHDWMVSPGGGEKVLWVLHQMWPEAPIYTSAFRPDLFPEFKNAEVRTTWLNKIGLAKRRQQLFSIPRAWAFMGLDLSGFDIVISTNSAESKYVKTGPKTLHICYCFTPTRYYWSDYNWYRQHPPFGWLNPVAKVVLPVLIPFLRRMDWRAAQKVDLFVAISRAVRARIIRYYQREAEIIYPPTQVDRFRTRTEPGKYYLVAGRQVAYKRLDLAVDAFNVLGLPLKVAGAGEEVAVQGPRSKSNISYLGRVSDKELADLYAGAKALIFPQEEDYGIVPVEAMASGRPVVAFAGGGALDTVIDGKTGLFFTEQTPEALISAVRRLETMEFDSEFIRRHAETLSDKKFEARFRAYVEGEWARFENRT